MRQLRDRGYAEKYRSHGLPVLLVGIEFNTETRNIEGYEATTA